MVHLTHLDFMLKYEVIFLLRKKIDSKTFISSPNEMLHSILEAGPAVFKGVVFRVQQSNGRSR